jgi:Retrotransposon gag protein
MAMRQTTISEGPSGGGAGGGGGGGGGTPGPRPPVPLPPAVGQAAANPKMMGALPAIFNGNREQADNFIKELKAYICLNNNVGGMNSYLKRIALALTLIKGPLVASWTRDFGDFFDTLNAANNIPATWTAFLDGFAHQFQNTQREEQAKLKLQTLHMKWPEIEQYIWQFEQLAREAGCTIGNSETKQFFIQGLPRGVAGDVMKLPLIHAYMDIKERAIESVKSRQVIDQIFGP